MDTINDDELLCLVNAFNNPNRETREEVWLKLRETGDRFVPFFEKIFAIAKRAEIRRDIAFHVLRFARTNESAFCIGLLALADRSSIVRYRGCEILAYSLREDALPALQNQLTHSDQKTVAEVAAAIDAIKHRNHHFFVDRNHSGRSFWQVNKSDLP